MRQKHIITRGNRHYFVCRVPHDLLQHFPRPTIWKALHTADNKAAAVVGTAYAHQTQQLFMQLRSGMLTPDLEKRLVASYLLHGTARILAQATGTAFTPPATSSPLDKLFKAEATMWLNGKALVGKAFALEGTNTAKANRIMKEILLYDIEQLREYLISKEPYGCPFDMEYLARELRLLTNIKMTDADKRALGLKLTDAQIQLHEAEAASLDGKWSHTRILQQNAENALKSLYTPIAEAVTKYKDYYRTSKPNIKPGTMTDMEVECRTLVEIVGNISIEAFNTMDTVAKVKAVLRKYPLNRKQRYGAKPLSAILKTSGYEVILPKTANEYIKRAKAVVDYALKSKLLESSNVWESELFQTEVAEEEQRSDYDTGDRTRLVYAICTKPLWHYNPPKPERFWLILIALFHGLRLGNIVALTKQDVCQNDRGLWVFKLRSGKTKSTVRDVAINDCLVLLGFLDWVERLPRNKLFQDTAATFSKFYNRNEKRKDGSLVQGFEAKYVTTDPKKCLYSLRHSFAGEVYGISTDYKMTSDMMGHSTNGQVTARYVKSVKTKILKEVMDKLEFHGIDLNMLEQRAIELFGVI